jgi:hypothetical protein
MFVTSVAYVIFGHDLFTVSCSRGRPTYEGPFIKAVIGPGPGGFPSSKFAHCEDAPRWVALLELLGLFSDSYVMMMRMLTGDDGGAPTEVPLSEDGVDVPALVDMVEGLPDLGMPADGGLGDDAYDGGDGGGEQHEPIAGPGDLGFRGNGLVLSCVLPFSPILPSLT